MGEEIGFSSWDPLAEDFNNEELNKYESGPGGNLQAESISHTEGMTKRELKRIKYPYIVIKKNGKHINDFMLSNYIGSQLIYDMEFIPSKLLFFVYFHNITAFEEAFIKLQRFNFGLDFVVGRPPAEEPTTNQDVEQNEQPESTSNPESTETNTCSLTIAEDKQEHPPFFPVPLVVKKDYTAKNSQLAINDVNRRYLSVKFDFTLERHGAYVLKESIDEDCERQYRFGRVLTVAKTPPAMPSTESVLSDEELKALFGAMKCCDCELHTDNSCKYCGIPYCNAICFNAICDEHEKLCKNFAKLPELERVKNNMRCKIPKLQQLELPPSGSSVQITAFEQTNVVYIRSVDMHSSVAYIKILSTVMRKGKCAPKLKHLPQTGQIVIYKFDREIVRAMVLNVDDPQAIYLVCVDFGNIEITTLDSLYECSTDLAELPRYAIPVLLRGIPRRYMRPEVRNVLYQIHDTFSFVLKYNEREFDSNGGMQRVLLFEREMNLSLNRLMKTLLTPVEPSFDIPGLTEKFLNHVSLPTGKNKKLVIMSNFYCNIGLLYCTTLDFAYEITLMQRDMQVYGESEKAFTYFAPSRGELCIAKYYGKWYRGKCVNLVGNGYPSILFIDYGHITPIHINSIRRYPPQFDFPILTTEFDIVDQPNDLTDEMIARLKNHFLTGSIIEFDEVIFNEKQNNYSLRINDLFKILNGA